MKHKYQEAFEVAMSMMESSELEPTSALKEAGSLVGIPYGPEMEKFVTWGLKQF